MLAYHYHWSKRDILNTVYPDEVRDYLKHIGNEKLQILKSRAIAAANAQTKDPKKLLNKIDKKLNTKTIKGSIDDIERLLRQKGKIK